ncbi:MAG: selenide, water dikinase SelD [Candidatus Dormibacteraeota bacterium]|nr:selenide, water dikinase SelD [Candidatus Dormibacteraeota bacterium]
MPPRLDNPDVLVGQETGDDAAVYRLRPDLALVVTTDFFTPIVDDAYTFGAIAAANALSDIYAMGAQPLMAVNLVAFPIKELGTQLLADILQGGLAKVREAGIDILGGHSIDDHEPKYGLAVTGTVHPDRVRRNRGGRPGDRLVLTKPLGSGVISTAIKHQVAPPASAAAAIEGMLRLNRDAAEAMATVEVHAATDVTGFGLLGHLHYLARASGLAARVDSASVPFLPGAQMLADAGEVPGGTRSNQHFLETRVRWPANLPAGRQVLLCDAQTSGGLLVAIPKEAVAPLLAALEARRVTGSVVGELTEGEAGSIVVA